MLELGRGLRDCDRRSKRDSAACSEREEESHDRLPNLRPPLIGEARGELLSSGRDRTVVSTRAARERRDGGGSTSGACPKVTPPQVNSRLGCRIGKKRPENQLSQRSKFRAIKRRESTLAFICCTSAPRSNEDSTTALLPPPVELRARAASLRSRALRKRGRHSAAPRPRLPSRHTPDGPARRFCGDPSVESS